MGQTDGQMADMQHFIVPRAYYTTPDNQWMATNRRTTMTILSVLVYKPTATKTPTYNVIKWFRWHLVHGKTLAPGNGKIINFSDNPTAIYTHSWSTSEFRGNYTLQSPFGPTSELRFGQKFEGKLSHLLSSSSTMAIVSGGGGWWAPGDSFGRISTKART